MPHEIGRNDPCPCGSGKKYKKCCLLKAKTAQPLTKQLLGDAATKALSLLVDFAVKFPEPIKERPLKRPLPVLPDDDAQNTLQNELITPWILYLWHPQGSPCQSLLSDRTVTARFLKQKGESLDGITRRYMEAARSEPFVYWQVEGVSPGSSLLLKDMVTGEERIVSDVASSSMATKWDIFFAQVVGLDGTYVFNGMGLYPLSPHRFRQAVDEFAEDIRKQVGKSADRCCLLKHQTEFILHYLKCVDEVLNPKLPDLRNMDGDKLVFTKSRYTFDASRRMDVIESLNALREMEDEGVAEGKTKFVWLALPKAAGRKDRVSKASISVGPDWMESECNSEARDKALRKRILKHLGPLITHESTNLKPFHPGKMDITLPDGAEDNAKELDLESLPEEERGRIKELFDQQHMSWIDEEVPMLGGKTPRETARTSEGKKRVAEMINDWENMQIHGQGIQFKFDFNKLRVELGIDLE